MTNWNRKLYTYLVDNIKTITDEWLLLRDLDGNTIYSINAGKEAEKTLREQNELTNRTIASSLLGSEGNFETNKTKWADLVAKSRVASNTPLPDVINAMGKVRKVYWKQIEQFVNKQEKRVPTDIILEWGETIHQAFDKLNISFARTYSELMDIRLSAQQSLINELGSPIIKLNNSIGVLPLVGAIDTYRARTLLKVIPARCTEINITKLFIDLSGVPVIDTIVANQIYQVAQVLNLLGINAAFTGIRPEIAQTSVQLGLDFSNVTTFSSLKQALEKGNYVLKKE